MSTESEIAPFAGRPFITTIQTKRVTPATIDSIYPPASLGKATITNAPLTTPTAMSRVLNTYELLDLILSKCQLWDLLVRLPRVSRTFNNVIANNQYIQHFLFFTPWGPHDYLYAYGLINPFIQFLEFKKGEDRGERHPIYDFGPGPKKSENEDTDDDGDDADWEVDWPEPLYYYEFNWERVKSDKRFMFERASWKRMLAIQPPKREVWNIVRMRGEFSDSQRARKIGAKGRLLGDIFQDILVQEAAVDCLRTKTYVRSSERYLAMLAVDVTLKPLDEEDNAVREDVRAENDVEESDVEESVVEESAVEDSVVEDSVVEESAVEESVVEESVVEEENVTTEHVAEKMVPETGGVVKKDPLYVYWIYPREINFKTELASAL